MKLARLLVVVVLVLACAKSTGAAMPAESELRGALIDAYNQGLSGIPTMGGHIVSNVSDATRFMVELRIDFKPAQGGWWMFRQRGDKCVVEGLRMPEWYLKEAREYVASDRGSVDAVLSQALSVAGGFTSWLDSQTEAVDKQVEGYPSAFGELRPVELTATLALHGRLATVEIRDWKILLEASERDGKWKLEVIAFERATP